MDLPIKFVSWFPLSTGLLLPIDNTTTSNIIKMCIRGCTKIEINIVRKRIQLLWFIAWRSEAAPPPSRYQRWCPPPPSSCWPPPSCPPTRQPPPPLWPPPCPRTQGQTTFMESSLLKGSMFETSTNVEYFALHQQVLIEGRQRERNSV